MLKKDESHSTAAGMWTWVRVCSQYLLFASWSSANHWAATHSIGCGERWSLHPWMCVLCQVWVRASQWCVWSWRAVQTSSPSCWRVWGRSLQSPSSSVTAAAAPRTSFPSHTNTAGKTGELHQRSHYSNSSQCTVLSRESSWKGLFQHFTCFCQCFFRYFWWHLCLCFCHFIQCL